MSVKDDLHFLIERYGYARRNGEHQGKKSAEWMAEIDHTIDACVAEALADPLAMLERLAGHDPQCHASTSQAEVVLIGQDQWAYWIPSDGYDPANRITREEAAALLKRGRR